MEFGVFLSPFFFKNFQKNRLKRGVQFFSGKTMLQKYAAYNQQKAHFQKKSTFIRFERFPGWGEEDGAMKWGDGGDFSKFLKIKDYDWKSFEETFIKP